MDALLQEILKHTTKISKVLTRVSEMHAELSPELDLALYSAIKIEKIITKHRELHPKAYDSRALTGQETDPIYDAALRNI